MERQVQRIFNHPAGTTQLVRFHDFVPLKDCISFVKRGFNNPQVTKVNTSEESGFDYLGFSWMKEYRTTFDWVISNSLSVLDLLTPIRGTVTEQSIEVRMLKTNQRSYQSEALSRVPASKPQCGVGLSDQWFPAEQWVSKVKPEQSPFWTVMIVLNGLAVYRNPAARSEFQLTPGDVVLFPSGEEYGLAEANDFVWININLGNPLYGTLASPKSPSVAATVEQLRVTPDKPTVILPPV